MLTLEEINQALHEELQSAVPRLKQNRKSDTELEYSGTIPVVQGKQKVDGHYFASIQEKPKDVRFYFFPIYTHAQDFQLSSPVKKCLKGKSCFHLKNLEEKEINEIREMIRKGLELYKKDGLI
jgi:hypothetical protein